MYCSQKITLYGSQPDCAIPHDRVCEQKCYTLKTIKVNKKVDAGCLPALDSLILDGFIHCVFLLLFVGSSCVLCSNHLAETLKYSNFTPDNNNPHTHTHRHADNNNPQTHTLNFSEVEKKILKCYTRQQQPTHTHTHTHTHTQPTTTPRHTHNTRTHRQTHKN